MVYIIKVLPSPSTLFMIDKFIHFKNPVHEKYMPILHKDDFTEMMHSFGIKFSYHFFVFCVFDSHRTHNDFDVADLIQIGIMLISTHRTNRDA